MLYLCIERETLLKDPNSARLLNIVRNDDSRRAHGAQRCRLLIRSALARSWCPRLRANLGMVGYEN